MDLEECERCEWVKRKGRRETKERDKSLLYEYYIIQEKHLYKREYDDK